MIEHFASEQDTGGRLTPSGTARFSGIDANILMGDDHAPFSVMEMVVELGMGAPAHISRREDKIFHITKGAFLFLIGEKRIEANEGDHLFVGQGQVHSFSAQGDGPARMTLVSTPANHDRFFQALSAIDTPHDPQDVEAVCVNYDQQIVGPIVQG